METIFLTDWSEQNFGNLDFYDLFDRFYPDIYEPPVPFTPDDDSDAGAVYKIPADIFEQVIERHFPIDHEELRRKAAYIPEENTSRAYTHKTVVRPLDDGGFQYVSNQIIFPEDGCV